jgi:hypothetical protein
MIFTTHTRELALRHFCRTVPYVYHAGVKNFRTPERHGQNAYLRLQYRATWPWPCACGRVDSIILGNSLAPQHGEQCPTVILIEQAILPDQPQQCLLSGISTKGPAPVNMLWAGASSVESLFLALHI